MFNRMTLFALAAILGLMVISDSAFAGRSPCPGSHRDRVLAYDTDVYTEYFRGGEVAVVVVCGDGDTDLDLFIYDRYGNLVASDTDSTDYCVVRFYPRWTAPYRIVIRNLGSVYNEYTLETN